MANKTMQAIQASDYGDPDVLVLNSAPRPEPKDGEVLIRVKASGVNPADWNYRSGAYKQFMPLQFPWTPGLEGSGVVEAVGTNVTSFKKGDEIYGNLKASYAEYTVTSEHELGIKPKSITFDEAAAVPMGALVAWQALIEKADLQAGQRVLVHGAAGGVGVYVVQLAKWKGAHVIGTASASNVDFLRSLGVETVIDYNKNPFETVVHDADVVIDTVGGDLPERSFQVLKRGGVFVTIAARLLENAGQQQGVRAMSSARASADKLQTISELIESKKLKPVVGKVFSLADASKAHELSQTRHGRGRIVLHVAE